jgi:hypothetical protein
MPDDKLIPFEVEVNVNKARVRVTLMLKARPRQSPRSRSTSRMRKTPKKMSRRSAKAAELRAYYVARSWRYTESHPSTARAPYPFPYLLAGNALPCSRSQRSANSASASAICSGCQLSASHCSIHSSFRPPQRTVGLSVPLHGLGVVLRNALASVVQDAEVILCFGVALVGQRTSQSQRGGINKVRWPTTGQSIAFEPKRTWTGRQHRLIDRK